MLTVEEIREIHIKLEEEILENKKKAIRSNLQKRVLSWLESPEVARYETWQIDVVKAMEEELVEAGYKVTYEVTTFFDEYDNKEYSNHVAVITWE